MSIPSRELPTYKGRYIGVVALTIAQTLVGFVHLAFGLWLLFSTHIELFAGLLGSSSVPDAYGIYTVVFGFLTLVFAGELWGHKWVGWVGNVAIALFVIMADFLVLLNLPSIPGIPKFAGLGEIVYSILVIIYLNQRHVKARYEISA